MATLNLDDVDAIEWARRIAQRILRETYRPHSLRRRALGRWDELFGSDRVDRLRKAAQTFLDAAIAMPLPGEDGNHADRTKE